MKGWSPLEVGEVAYLSFLYDDRAITKVAMGSGEEGARRCVKDLPMFAYRYALVLSGFISEVEERSTLERIASRLLAPASCLSLSFRMSLQRGGFMLEGVGLEFSTYPPYFQSPEGVFFWGKE